MSSFTFAGVELGGTKTICSIGDPTSGAVDRLTVVTTTPEETLAPIVQFIKAHAVDAIGLASFGPLNVDASDDQYGRFYPTPKPHWTGFAMGDYFKRQFDCPIHIETDVAAAGLAENQLGAGQGLRNLIYITVGTGIGAAAIIDGKPVAGLNHPEMGHLSLLRVQGDEAFESSCPYHSHCAEGLASGTAITKRWGKALNHFEVDHPAWQVQSQYLAQFIHAITLLYAPQKIVIGGGVSSEQLLQKVRQALLPIINGYVPGLDSTEALDSYICLPKLAGEAGPTGSLLVAEQALAQIQES
jgi:fructokinase